MAYQNKAYGSATNGMYDGIGWVDILLFTFFVFPILQARDKT